MSRRSSKLTDLVSRRRLPKLVQTGRIQFRSIRVLALEEIAITAFLHPHLSQVVGPLSLHILPALQIPDADARIMRSLHRPVEAVKGLLVEVEIVSNCLLPGGRGSWYACDIA